MQAAELDPRAANTADAIHGLRTPGLLIHGEDDIHVPAKHSRELQDVIACGQLLILPETGGHIASHLRLEWLEEWILPFLVWSESPPADCRNQQPR